MVRLFLSPAGDCAIHGFRLAILGYGSSVPILGGTNGFFSCCSHSDNEDKVECQTKEYTKWRQIYFHALFTGFNEKVEAKPKLLGESEAALCVLGQFLVSCTAVPRCQRCMILDGLVHPPQSRGQLCRNGQLSSFGLKNCQAVDQLRRLQICQRSLSANIVSIIAILLNVMLVDCNKLVQNFSVKLIGFLETDLSCGENDAGVI